MAATSKRQRLGAVDQLTPEQRFFAYGGDRPTGFGLHCARSKEGIDARVAITYLLAQIQQGGAFALQARNILDSCARPSEKPLSWPDLMALHQNYWRATQPLLDYVWRAGGLRYEDFDDGGAEFCRLVYPGSNAAFIRDDTR